MLTIWRSEQVHSRPSECTGIPTIKTVPLHVDGKVVAPGHLSPHPKSFDLGVVDLFATRSNFKLPTFGSPAWKEDALNISWESLIAYAFTPPALMTAVVDKFGGRRP